MSALKLQITLLCVFLYAVEKSIVWLSVTRWHGIGQVLDEFLLGHGLLLFFVMLFCYVVLQLALFDLRFRRVHQFPHLMRLDTDMILNFFIGLYDPLCKVLFSDHGLVVLKRAHGSIHLVAPALEKLALVGHRALFPGHLLKLLLLFNNQN